MHTPARASDRFSRPKAQFAHAQRATTFASYLPEDWLVNLYEGDVFGEEAMFDSCIGSSRPTTAVAATVGDGATDEDVELLYLTRQQYDAISSPHMQVGLRSAIDSGRECAQQPLGTGNQVMCVEKQTSR